MKSLEMNCYKGCLKSQAFISEQSRGRRYLPLDDVDCVLGNDPFVTDLFRILHSSSFRRLKGKRQVIANMINPHIRERRSHTEEVLGTALRMAEMLGLNYFLSMAVAAGHDLGQPPFGHLGERVLTKITGKQFAHNVFGVVIVQELERKGQGINLSFETLKGIECHSYKHNFTELYSGLPLEIYLVALADVLTYIFSDLKDILRQKIRKTSELPDSIWILGESRWDRMRNCINALVRESAEMETISFFHCPEAQAFRELRSWFFEIYPEFDYQEDRQILERVYEYVSQAKEFDGCDPGVLLASMMDSEVCMISSRLCEGCLPSLEDLEDCGFMEIVPYIQGKQIDFTNPDLSWGESNIAV